MNFHKSIFKLECIPVGCVPPAAVAVCWEGGVCLIACWDTRPTPLGVGLENPQVWAWRPPGQTPQPPPGFGPGDPPPTPQPPSLGVGLETHPPLWTEFLPHASVRLSFCPKYGSPPYIDPTLPSVQVQHSHSRFW